MNTIARDNRRIVVTRHAGEQARERFPVFAGFHDRALVRTLIALWHSGAPYGAQKRGGEMRLCRLEIDGSDLVLAGRVPRHAPDTLLIATALTVEQARANVEAYMPRKKRRRAGN